MNTVASAIHGAKKQLQACLPHPGELIVRCTSPGRTPSQYIVLRCPTGYDVWVCTTIFGFDVVPDVK